MAKRNGRSGFDIYFTINASGGNTYREGMFKSYKESKKKLNFITLF